MRAGRGHVLIDRIAPTSPIVDLSHGVSPLDVTAGAMLLADSLAYIGDDAVVLAVVDPSVGPRSRPRGRDDLIWITEPSA